MKCPALFYACALGLTLSGVTPAEEPSNPAADVLTRVTHALAGTKRFSCRMDLDFQLRSDGMNQQIHSGYLVALERPNRFAFLHRTGMPTASFVSNGEELYSYSPVFNRYLIEPAPDDPEQLPAASEFWVLSVSASLGGMNLLDPLLSKNPALSLLQAAERIEYAGREELDKQPMDRLRVVQPDMTWDLWIHASGLPVPYRASPDLTELKKQMSAQRPDLKNVSAELILSFSDWSIGRELPGDTFTFAVPEGAEQVLEPALLMGDAPAESVPGPEQSDFKVRLDLGESP